MEHFTECPGGWKIFIPKSKTDKFRNGSHVFLKHSDEKWSISNLFKRYLDSFDLSLGENHFLFFPIKNAHGKWFKLNKILSYASYRDIVKDLVEKIGLDPKIYGTHSLRSGGATELASHLTEHELLVSGRWSDARSIRLYVEMSNSARLDINECLQSTIKKK